MSKPCLKLLPLHSFNWLVERILKVTLPAWMEPSLNPDKSSTFIPSRRPHLTRRGCKSQPGEINQRLIKLRHNPPPAAATTGIIIPKKPSDSEAGNLHRAGEKMTNDLSKKKGKTAGDKKGKRKVKRRETYAMYIYKVLKQVSGELPINSACCW